MGESGRCTSSSLLSERSREWVELQSDMEDRDRRVYEGAKPPPGRGGAEGFSGLSRQNSLRVGGPPAL